MELWIDSRHQIYCRGMLLDWISDAFKSPESCQFGLFQISFHLHNDELNEQDALNTTHKLIKMIYTYADQTKAN